MKLVLGQVVELALEVAPGVVDQYVDRSKPALDGVDQPAALLFTVFMYAVAETLAARVTKEEDYIGATPAVAILPFFFAGALFPITAMPAVLTAIAKVFPLTHALALMRYGFIDPGGKGLHDIWGMHSVTAEAWLSLAVIAVWAVALTAISIRVFSRSAVS